MRLSFTKRRIMTILIWLLLAVAFLMVTFPVLWVFLTSLKPWNSVFTIPPTLFFKPSSVSYTYLFVDSRFALGVNLLLNMRNSLICATSSMIIAMIASMYAAYGLSRYTFRGKKAINGFIIATRLLPPIGTIIPFFLLINSLGLIDSLWGLILAYTALNIPLSTWLLRGFLDEVPVELDEAAIIDGCGSHRTLWTIVTPLCAPGLVSTAVQSFVLSWNDFSLANVLTKRQSRTLPLVVSSFMTDEGVYWGPLSAAAIIVFIPPIVLFLLTYKHLAKGLTVGAVKG